MKTTKANHQLSSGEKKFEHGCNCTVEMMECGCGIHRQGDELISIENCPLHHAAPELLAICERIYACENERDDFAPAWMTELRKVIAKAKP